MSDNDRLARELRSRADHAAGHPISIDDVKRSATKLKRRQRAATGVAAAVVLAIGVPVGMSIGAGSTEQPSVTGPSLESPSLIPDVTPADGLKVALTANVEQHSGEPSIIISFDGEIVLPNGQTVPSGQTVANAVPSGEDGSFWYGLTPGPGTTGWVLQGFDQEGPSGASRPVTPQIAVSQPEVVGGSPEISYFTTGDRTLHLVSPTGNVVDDWEFAKGTDVVPIGILDQGVVYETAGTDPVLMLARRGGDTEPIPGYIGGGAVFAGANLVAGQTSYSDTDGTSCWAVTDIETQRRLFEECDYTLTGFSPDGQYLVGNNSDTEGMGSATVAVMDATTGDLVVEFAADTRAGSHISSTVWETSGSLLTMLYDEGWALMRLGIDGTFSNVSTGRIAGEPESTPLLFGARP